MRLPKLNPTRVKLDALKLQTAKIEKKSSHQFDFKKRIMKKNAKLKLDDTWAKKRKKLKNDGFCSESSHDDPDGSQSDASSSSSD